MSGAPARSRHARWIRVALVGGAMALVAPPSGSAQGVPCGCRGHPTALDAWKAGRLLLEATVVDVEARADEPAHAEAPWLNRRVRVRVERWWPAGRPVGVPIEIGRDLTLYTMAGVCGYPFETDRAYFIALNKFAGRIPWTRQCSGTQAVGSPPFAVDSLGPGRPPGERETFEPDRPSTDRISLLPLIAVGLLVYVSVAGTLLWILRRERRRGA